MALSTTMTTELSREPCERQQRAGRHPDYGGERHRAARLTPKRQPHDRQQGGVAREDQLQSTGVIGHGSSWRASPAEFPPASNAKKNTRKCIGMQNGIFDHQRGRRLSAARRERKLYELVTNGAIPCSKVTGKWLFRGTSWTSGCCPAWPARPACSSADPPPVVGGSQDGLLEWSCANPAPASPR